MNNDFKDKVADWLKQKTYEIYDEEGEFIGGVDGHDEAHAISKFAQYDECNPKTLTAKRAWPNSEH